ncbi:MAG TPA: aminodeoxychorismate synthase component I [Gemmatimonadales bacterium]|nr:aminodeoxychorismate synthase component I [Gemmatimonadales bacterium]
MTGFAPLVESLGSLGDPAEIAERFIDLPYLLLLDSATGALPSGEAHPLGRFSFLTADPAVVVRSKGSRTEVGRAGRWEPAAGDALGVVRSLLSGWQVDPAPGLPPFQGGAAGYIGYDYGSVLERLPAPRFDDLAIHDVLLGLYDWVIAWDHRVGAAWILSTGLPADGEARARRARARLDEMLRRVRAPEVRRRLPPPAAPGDGPAPAPSYPVTAIDGADLLQLRSTFTHRGYLDAVTRVRDYIVAGDIFQANLSQRFQAPLREAPWDLYRRLRRRNPAAFAAYLGFEDVTVLSASPERFLRLDENGRHVETRPIKGTRPRGLGPMHDAALGRALAESDKDRSENVMIVDLLRNDLSRVCRAGTVRVPELFALEQHPTVHHLVSTVVGELAPEADAVDLLRAAFPGGSITGAPKVRAMEIIAELEPTRRGVYCGSIGYLSATGAMDTSIVIRTFTALRGRVYFQAGGGIVADSDPEMEYRETLDKARALVDSLGSRV